MEIGFFQLENLATTPSRFRLLDLRREVKSVDPLIDRLLKMAVPVLPDQIPSYLREQNLPGEMPLVLVCEDGVTSAEVAKNLENSGHQQIYIVRGGIVGLLSEV